MTSKKKKPDLEFQDDLGHEIDMLDNLLNRGMDKLSDIEIDEMTMGFSEEELSQKLKSGNLLKVGRSEFSSARKVGDLTFDESVQFIIENDVKSVSEIPLERLEPLDDVEPGQLVAYCEVDEQRPALHSMLQKDYEPQFCDAAGIEPRMEGSRFSLFATRSGKAVFFNKKLYIIPADHDATFEIQVDADRMSARVSFFPPKGAGAMLTSAKVMDELDQCSVRRGIDRNAIEESINLVNTTREAVIDVVVAKGQMPRDGTDAPVKFHFSTAAPEIAFKILPDGKIDYKKEAPIKMVKRGDLLATLGEATAGEDGYCVDGRVLAANPGNVELVLEGENVRKGEDGRSFYAEADGMISFHENILSVFPHYHVNSDVDMKSGNINFNGSVTVLGTVRSGFEVRATGDIFIINSVEAASISAGRDIRVNGAIVGGGGTVVKAGRNVFVGHVQNATIEAEGDITVVRSVMHSFIYSTGKVILHDGNGSIVGGVVHALKGIESMSIGSPMGTQTEVVVGSDFLVQRKKQELMDIAAFHQTNVDKIDIVLRPLMDIVKKGIPLGSEKKRRLTTIVEKRKKIVKQLAIIKQKAGYIAGVAASAGDGDIHVQRILYPDVLIKMGNAMVKTTEERRAVHCKPSADKEKIEFKSIRAVN